MLFAIPAFDDASNVTRPFGLIAGIFHMLNKQAKFKQNSYKKLSNKTRLREKQNIYKHGSNRYDISKRTANWICKVRNYNS